MRISSVVSALKMKLVIASLLICFGGSLSFAQTGGATEVVPAPKNETATGGGASLGRGAGGAAANSPGTAPISLLEGPPLYELGLGLGATYFPHYPGADQSRLYVMPFPFVVVRGKIIQNDRQGMRARLLTGKSFDVSMSGAGAFPVKSGENRAREGMEELGWIGQGGPKLRFGVAEFESGGLLRLGFSVRLVVASAHFLDIEHRGFAYEPEIVFTQPDFLFKRIDLYTSLRTTFATSGLNTYYYHVSQDEARADRPAYNARGGLVETTATLGFSLRSPDSRHRWFVSTDFETLEGAANLASPLVKSRVNHSFALAWIWTFWESDSKASVIY